MNYLVFRAARLLLLLVLAAALPVLAAGRTVSRRLRAMLVTLVVLSALAFVNFGFFHVFSGQRIHYWDAFHYFVGAKYLPELGYTRLYEATWLAGREMGAFADIEWIRDLPTYQARHTRSIDAAAVRARFTDARWRAFKQDLLVFGPRIPDWRRLFLDHGFNDPPPRAMLLHALLRWAPATPTTLALVTSIDYVLIAGALWSARVAFGPVAGAVGAAFFFLNFFGRFDFIGGSILRWDWIAALIFGIAAFARGAGITAGLCIAYAVLARLFPVAFLVPLVIKWIQIRRTGAVDRTLDRCLTASAVLLVTIALMLGLAGDSVLIAEFVTKIRLHGETAFTNHVGLGTWLVFQTASWTIHEGVQTVEPAAVMAARPAPWIVPTVSALYLGFALPLILRARPLESMMYAVPLVYCVFSPAGYYYSFLVVLVLLPWHSGVVDRSRLLAIALLALVNVAGYAFEILSHDHLPLFHAVSALLGAYFVAWLALEYARLGIAAVPLTWQPSGGARGR
jgi:hypothetical protein